jgi:hypothetical protein
VKCWPLTVMNLKKRKINGRRREEDGRLTAIWFLEKFWS